MNGVNSKVLGPRKHNRRSVFFQNTMVLSNYVCNSVLEPIKRGAHSIFYEILILGFEWSHLQWVVKRHEEHDIRTFQDAVILGKDMQFSLRAF